jgi:plastocyanin
MTKHTVILKLDDTDSPIALSGDPAQVLWGDQICWTSDDGIVEVEFVAGTTPFDPTITKGGATPQVVVAKPGLYSYHCAITTPDKKTHGWPTNPGGGGTVDVRHG